MVVSENPPGGAWGATVAHRLHSCQLTHYRRKPVSDRHRYSVKFFKQSVPDTLLPWTWNTLLPGMKYFSQVLNFQISFQAWYPKFLHLCWSATFRTVNPAISTHFTHLHSGTLHNTDDHILVTFLVCEINPSIQNTLVLFQWHWQKILPSWKLRILVRLKFIWPMIFKFCHMVKLKLKTSLLTRCVI